MHQSQVENVRGGSQKKSRTGFIGLRNRNVSPQWTQTTTGKDSVFPPKCQRTEPLKILQLNVQGGVTLRHAQMRKLLLERGIQVILAQEELLGRGKSYPLPGYEMLHFKCIEQRKKSRNSHLHPKKAKGKSRRHHGVGSHNFPALITVRIFS